MIEENKKKFIFDLQIFAEGDGGEKTEQATPRRREDARKKGQVFKSADLNSAVILITGSVLLYLTMASMIDILRSFTSLYILDRTMQDFSVQYASELLLEVIYIMARMLLPILVGTFIAAFAISYLQVGAVISSEALTPKLERINPIEGFKRIFSRRALMELVKSLFKVGITGYIVYTVIKKYYYLFPRFLDMELTATCKAFGAVVFEMAIKVGVCFVILGLIDYIYQWFEYEKSLKMSKHEVKQEYKQAEGDPLIKSRQKQIQREFAMKRMMSEVPKADVVITNPTHFAVALKYEFEAMDAPVVVARGQDFVALRIKEIARQNNVTIVEDPPLARTLYYSTDLGDAIPEELYQSIAEILAFIYKQKRIVL
ncbi:MAG: flagellar biosynthesis protein FlhB [Deltaproteobacteria bacterium]